MNDIRCESVDSYVKILGGKVVDGASPFLVAKH